MMYESKTSASAVAASAPVALGIGALNWDVGYQVVASGTITFNVEVSIDGVVYFPVATGLTASSAGALTFPCKFVRVNNTAGTGSTVLSILEVR